MFKRLSVKFIKFGKTPSARYGIPFVLFVVGGSFGLQKFTEIKFKYANTGVLIHEEAKKAGIEMKKPEEVTLEAVYDSVKDIDIENWKNVRGPRPWEE
ncbi:cytochrome c oxidase assembly protein COX16 homolog, mitochondrial [Athalia rosae]|uniref:cytochrome c oxidase assembly protein COX16 homolog, mitochondrial n=1 Tax=Athalia rosae TaxID=37344 RepID=UPI0006265922|nr:cytochrome c oxidase assembly protein COX16 homolog, mitochondrial [Athalia rosae]